MSAFHLLEDLLGLDCSGQFQADFHHLLGIVRDIHFKLQRQSPLLKDYLSCFIIIAGSKHDSGYLKGGIEAVKTLRKLCGIVVGDEPSDAAQIKDIGRFIRTHPLPYKDAEICTEIYTVLLSSECLKAHMSFIITDDYAYHRELKHSGAGRLLYLRKQMAEILGGGEELERLDCLLHKLFLPIKVVDLAALGVTDGILDSLMRLDWNSGRRMFEFFFDGWADPYCGD